MENFMSNFIKIKNKLKYLLRKKPDFIIIGVQKGGTSSLFKYLSYHPQIVPSKKKEVHFFDNNFELGKYWYMNFFPWKWKCMGKKTGEASPYYIYHPHALARIKNHLPNVRLILLLRNPVERAFSEYNMALRKGKENITSFEEAIKKEIMVKTEQTKMLNDPSYKSYFHQTFSYISRSMYADQIKSLLKYFSKEQVLIIKSEDFYINPKKN
jgi:hypothetical protein